MEALKGEIVENKKYAHNLYKLEVFSPYICRSAEPAQFVNVKCSAENVSDPLLRRPFSIYDIDKQFNVFSILFLVKGKGTVFMANLKKGDMLDFVGPLGQGFKVPVNQQKYVLLGGGIGVAPLCLIAKNLIENGKSVSFIAGFKDETFYLWEKDLIKILRDYTIFSENGAFGQKGLPVSFIYENLGNFKGNQFIVCGPAEMLKQVQSIFKNKNISAMALMEERMACGIGTCMGCVLKIKKSNGEFEYKKICTDGPVFDLMEVCFE